MANRHTFRVWTWGPVDALDLDSLFELDAVNVPHTLKFCPKYQVRIHTPSDWIAIFWGGRANEARDKLRGRKPNLSQQEPRGSKPFQVS